jgi:hypothetical protein
MVNITLNLFSRAQANFALAKNEQRRRPIIDSIAQDSNGNYVDQIASDTINYSSANRETEPENYPKHYHAGMKSVLSKVLFK